MNADINASVRRIDLICKLGGPLLIALLDGYSTEIAILVNLMVNVASIPIEYTAIANVHFPSHGLFEHRNNAPSGSQECTPTRTWKALTYEPGKE